MHSKKYVVLELDNKLNTINKKQKDLRDSICKRENTTNTQDVMFFPYVVEIGVAFRS